jgi:hypothetical protein
LVTGNPKLGAFVSAEEAAQIKEASHNGQLLNFEQAGHFMYRGMTVEKFDNFISLLKAQLNEYINDQK